MSIKITGIRGDVHSGKTYDVKNLKTGKEYTIDQYPKMQRGAGMANYIVSEKYGEALRKFITLSGAKKFIEKLGKVI
jgi:hypothetical protein